VTTVQTFLLSALVLAGAVLAIERAYSGVGLLDPVVLIAVAVTLVSGVLLLSPRNGARPE
jgi:hypothetical protein